MNMNWQQVSPYVFLLNINCLLQIAKGKKNGFHFLYMQHNNAFKSFLMHLIGLN